MNATARRARTRAEAVADLGASFKGAMAAVRRLRGRDTQRPGELGFAQFQLLGNLADRNALSVGELAVAAELSPASVTQLIDGLGELGLVERTRSESDRRVVTCSLTKRGRDVVAKRRTDFEERWQTALAGFSTKELSNAAAVLQRLQALVEDLGR